MLSLLKQATPILSLPSELLSHTLSFLDTPDRTFLASCARISKSFNDIATPLLYRRVVVSKHLKLGILGSQRSNGGTAKRKSLLGHMRTLVISSFDTELCDGLIETFSHAKARVKTIEISRQDAWNWRNGRFAYTNSSIEPLNPIIGILKPTRLVVTQSTTGLAHNLCLVNPLTIHEELQELCFVSDQGRIQLSPSTSIWLATLPFRMHSLKKITCILDLFLLNNVRRDRCVEDHIKHFAETINRIPKERGIEFYVVDNGRILRKSVHRYSLARGRMKIRFRAY
ncbi:hypothetical protein I302_100439 [Kwoniella bestiolae CBS 10118]|uniref:F-box domain-containing protein n=1 Tax=Kwoniella bestiolae CBS 10118 TaxID=1296100 RepID=A0A1B9G524_9TREE|nr:hypothetical protein I302_03815 [Kwoniella bestiolae CBS 10118]OCF26137.1 hypothetical protein I302_03815 [Kwoniella bestiolae CBS 10118]